MSAASNRAHRSALGIWPVGHPVCGLQAAADTYRLRAARRCMGGLVDQWRQALVAGAPRLRRRAAVVHVAYLCHGAELAGIGTQGRGRQIAGAGHPEGARPCTAPCQVMGGIGGRSPADVDAMVTDRPGVPRAAMVAPGQRCLRALPTTPGEIVGMVSSAASRSVSGFVVTPGQTLTGETLKAQANFPPCLDWLGLSVVWGGI